MPVSREDCQALLRREAKRYGSCWIISGYPYPEKAALQLAELSLRSGQRLVAVIDAGWALSVARRLDALEERLEALEGNPHPAPENVKIKEEYYG